MTRSFQMLSTLLFSGLYSNFSILDNTSNLNTANHTINHRSGNTKRFLCHQRSEYSTICERSKTDRNSNRTLILLLHDGGGGNSWVAKL